MARIAGALLLVIVTITLALVGIGNVYAQTVMVTPSTVTQGNSFRVSGTEFDPSSPGIAEVYSDASGGCVGSVHLFQNVTSDSSGNVHPVTISSRSLAVGTHCVEVVTFAYDTASSALVTVTAVVPS